MDCLDSLRNEGETEDIATLGRTKIDGYKSFAGSIFNAEDVERTLSAFRPDRIFLLAWETAHGSYWHDPVNRDWADATLSFANRAAELGTKVISFAGTCAEYVWGPEWLDDSMDLFAQGREPATLYGREKLRTTRGLLALAKEQQVICQSCRIFSPYCEIENASRITSVVVQKVLAGETLHLTSGDVYRDIAHTKRIADAMVRLSNEHRSGLFNVATGEPQHMGQFLKNVAGHLQCPDLVTWDLWDDDNMQPTQPRYLVGTVDRLGFPLGSPEELEADIAAFAHASVERFRP